MTDTSERAALEELAAYALPKDAPGAWIRRAIADMLHDAEADR